MQQRMARMLIGTHNVARAWLMQAVAAAFSREELLYFYSRYEMADRKPEGSKGMKNASVEIGEGILLSFAAYEELYRRQLGYRWVGEPAAPEEAEDWPAGHVVIAVFNDDPVIADTSSQGTPVLASFEGGPARRIADDLAGFFAALSDMIQGAAVMQGETHDDETFEVKEEYLDRIEPGLKELLGETNADRLLRFFSLRW